MVWRSSCKNIQVRNGWEAARFLWPTNRGRERLIRALYVTLVKSETVSCFCRHQTLTTFNSLFTFLFIDHFFPLSFSVRLFAIFCTAVSQISIFVRPSSALEFITLTLLIFIFNFYLIYDRSVGAVWLLFWIIYVHNRILVILDLSACTYINIKAAIFIGEVELLALLYKYFILRLCN